MRLLVAAAFLALPTISAADCSDVQEAAQDYRALTMKMVGHGGGSAAAIAVLTAQGKLDQDAADWLVGEISTPIIDDAEAAIDTAVKWKDAASNCR